MANEKNLPAKSSPDKPKKNKQPSRLNKWFREMRSELKKVIWPTPKSTISQTTTALAVMLVAAIVIWGFDTLATSGVRALITLFSLSG
jgi:preprotein translocase, SecE subunit, bacterial